MFHYLGKISIFFLPQVLGTFGSYTAVAEHGQVFCKKLQALTKSKGNSYGQFFLSQNPMKDIE